MKNSQFSVLNSQLPRGYKQTEVGVIPDDWEILQVADVVEGRRIPSGVYKDQNLYGKGSKIIKLGDVFALDYFQPDSAQRVVLNAYELLTYRVKLGDIFIALASVKLEGGGKVMLVDQLDEHTAYDHNVALIRTNTLLATSYLFYILKSGIVRKQIGKLATQVGTTFLKASSILALNITIPPTIAE